jgi:ribosomal protein L7Ae-like RNA K-turn-binding protein
MNEKKFLQMLGLCRRAAGVIIGTPLVTKALPSGKVMIVFYSDAASENTKKRISDKCSYYNVKIVKIDTPPDKLGHMLGKTGDVCVIGVTDERFSKQLEILAEEN